MPSNEIWWTHKLTSWKIWQNQTQFLRGWAAEKYIILPSENNNNNNKTVKITDEHVIGSLMLQLSDEQEKVHY